MSTLFFIRHAQSVANAGGITMEHASIPLSPLGQAQANALAGLLDVNPSRVFVSEYLRARETARPFCERVGLGAKAHPLLHEFSTLDPGLLEGMNGEQRRPLMNAYWEAADPSVRKGPRAETFLEFEARVSGVMAELPALPDRSVLFGHGMWLGLLCWKLIGFSADSPAGMKAFRRFQTGLPMPNCAVYRFESAGEGRWTWRADEQTMRRIASVRALES
jgi:broad specificity phosphatase PhoE